MCSRSCSISASPPFASESAAAWLFRLGRAARCFLVRLPPLIRQHALFRTPAAAPFLPPYFLRQRPVRRNGARLESLDFVQQQAPGNKPIQSLLARLLALHLHTGGPVQNHDTGGGLVDVLPAMAA